MKKKTKKLNSAARFGVRYGMKHKRILARVERVQRAKHACPSCGKVAVKRESPGVWVCTKCGYKFAGGAYYPSTSAGKLVHSMIKSKLGGVSV